MTIADFARQQLAEVADCLRGGDAPHVRVEDGSNPLPQTWKILIYDDSTQKLLSTLMKAGQLRQHGITLHLNIKSERQPVPDTGAIYLVRPTEENIDIIAKDISRVSAQRFPMYKRFFLNFSSAVDQQQLQKLAKEAVHAGTSELVQELNDRHLDFISLSASEFELGITNTLETFYSMDDSAIMRALDEMTTGLVSLFATLRMVPVIKVRRDRNCTSHYMAQTLLVRLKAAVDNNVIRSNMPRGAYGRTKRPLLMLFDRDCDIGAPLLHSWSYRSLIKDLLVIETNRLTVQTKGASGTNTIQHDLDSADYFWTSWQDLEFPSLLELVNRQVESYQEEMKALADKQNMIDDAIASAVNNLPKLTERKRLLDIHTNVSTELLQIIRERKIDEFYEFESSILNETLTVKSAIQKIEQFYENKTGLPSDRFRCVLSLLTCSWLPPLDRKKIMETLRPRVLAEQTATDDVFAFISSKGGSFDQTLGISKPRQLQMKDILEGVNPHLQTLWDHGRGIVKQGVKTVQAATYGRGNSSYIAQTVPVLMRSSLKDEELGFVTFDPLHASTDFQFIPINESGQGEFSQAIAFVVGDGAVEEAVQVRNAFSARDDADRTGVGNQSSFLETAASVVQGVGTKPVGAKVKHVLYGCATFTSPDKFLSQLSKAAVSKARSG